MRYKVVWCLIFLVFSVSALAAVPTIDSIKLNSTDPTTNNATQNLSVWVTTSDSDGDDVKVIYNWLLNSTPFTSLNMPFENESNSTTFTRDYSGLGNTGNITGATWNSTAGYDGKGAYDFAGTDSSYVIKDNFVGFPTSFISVAFWIKSTGSADGILAYATSSEYNEFTLFDQDNIVVYIGGVQKTTGVDVNDGAWHHVVITWNDTDNSLKAYKNGAQAYSNTLTNAAMDDGGCLVLAQEQDARCGGYDSAQAMPGVLDDLLIFNQTISGDQVLLLYQNKTNQIHSNETATGDVWVAEATPNDGFSNGATSTSNNITIGTADSEEGGSSPVPEWQDYALFLILGTIITGFFRIRSESNKKK